MDRIFWGMAFVLLDIDLSFGNMTVGLIPDWLGYWWLFRGFWELEEKWDGFRKGRRPMLILAVFSGVLYGMKLLALSVRQEFLLWALGLAAAVAGVIVTRLVGRGVRHMEAENRWELRGGKLGNLWLYLAVLQVFSALLSWVPLVGTVCAVASAVMTLCWLAALWDAKKRFYRMDR